MHFLSAYIQPMTTWLHAHPHLALIITFLISLTESLAIIGSIIPGSLAMTAVGILAGSGVMRIDLTYIAAILGAIAGDVSSYALGYIFSDRIFKIWPIRNYPKWIKYGQDYFTHYGAVSVLIGRFVGPLRSIIPVIAGMMHMGQWQFLCANVLSAIGWAIIYVTPGVLIGTASSELSPENATRLFIIILMLLAITWLTSLGLRRLFSYINYSLQRVLNQFWLRLQGYAWLAPTIKSITPADEQNHARTFVLILSLFFFTICSVFLIINSFDGSYITSWNKPTAIFFKSLRTPRFDNFFIIFSLTLSLIPLMTLWAALALTWVGLKNWRTLFYWSSLCVTSLMVTLLLDPTHDETNFYLSFDLPINFLILVLAMSLFGFLILYLRSLYRSYSVNLLTTILIFLLILGATGEIYLGDHALSTILTAFCLGATSFLIHWFFYRCSKNGKKPSLAALITIFTSFILTAAITNGLFFKKMVHLHVSQFGQYVVTDEAWWNQEKPLLPIYRMNRLGQRIGLLNVQYAGSLFLMEKTLEKTGWKRQSNSFFYSLLMRVGNQNNKNIPLMSQFYLNRKPVLIMTKTLNPKEILILRFWRSNFHLRHYAQPIWLGSISLHNAQNTKMKEAYLLLLPALPQFKFQHFVIPKNYLRPLPHPNLPMILLIKDPSRRL